MNNGPHNGPHNGNGVLPDITQPFVPFGVGGSVGYSGHFSSTLYEGIARGWADVLRSRGEAARLHSEAMVNVETARARFIDNQERWARVYLIRQEILQAEREHRRAYYRRMYANYMAAQEVKRDPFLRSGEYVPETGTIIWPSVLMGEAFDPYRARLEELFVLRTQTRVRTELAGEILTATLDMQEALRDYMLDLPVGEYMAARRFLDRLSYTGRSSAIDPRETAALYAPELPEVREYPAVEMPESQEFQDTQDTPDDFTVQK